MRDRYRGSRGWRIAFGLAAVVAVHAAPASAATPTASEFSAGISAGAAPEGITAGPDGNLWFTEFEGDQGVGRITPAGAVTEYNISDNFGPAGITTGPDGALWFAMYHGNLIGRISTSGVRNDYIGPNEPNDITAGPDGNLWITEEDGNRIGRMTPAGVYDNFTAGISANAGLADITAGPDGNLWFTEYFGDRIGRISPTGAVTEFPLTPLAGPLGITAGPDGNLWFTEFNGSRIGRITPSGTVTEFSAGISAASAPAGIVAGPDGNLWFTELNGNRIGRITPSGAVGEFSAGVSSDAGPRGIASGPDGNLWFAETRGDRIGRINTSQNPAGFRNQASIAAPAEATTLGPAGPYPSPIDVSGLEGTITDVDVRLTGLSHSNVRDLDFLLVGPQGQTTLLASDVGSSNPDPHGVSWTLDDEAASPLPFAPPQAPLVSGIFRPTDNSGEGADGFSSPAPAGPYGAALSSFDGSAPNGVWRLFVEDDASFDQGRLYGGWGLDIATTGPPATEPPPEGGGGDTRVALALGGKRKQKLKKLAVEAGCGDEACTVEAGGTVSAKPKRKGRAALKRKRFALAPVSASLAAGETETLRLKVKGKKKAKALGKLIKKGAKAKAAIEVTATDAAGNVATESLTVILKK